MKTLCNRNIQVLNETLCITETKYTLNLTTIIVCHHNVVYNPNIAYTRIHNTPKIYHTIKLYHIANIYYTSRMSHKHSIHRLILKTRIYHANRIHHTRKIYHTRNYMCHTRNCNKNIQAEYVCVIQEIVPIAYNHNMHPIRIYHTTAVCNTCKYGACSYLVFLSQQ